MFFLIPPPLLPAAPQKRQNLKNLKNAKLFSDMSLKNLNLKNFKNFKTSKTWKLPNYSLICLSPFNTQQLSGNFVGSGNQEIVEKFQRHLKSLLSIHWRWRCCLLQRKVTQASERDLKYQTIMRNLVRRYVTQVLKMTRIWGRQQTSYLSKAPLRRKWGKMTT